VGLVKTRLGIAIAVAVLGFALPASADTVANFTLDGVTFDDGGTATGSFTLDLTTSTLSNVNITTSTDSALELGDTYTSGTFSNSPSASFDFANGFFLDGDDFNFTLGSALTPFRSGKS
jgi:hypothetical protein